MPGYNVSDIARQSCQNAPAAAARVALRFEGSEMTYGELGRRVDLLAAGLVRAGVRKGDRVAILLHNRLEFVEIFFAVARVGGVAVPINYLLTAPEIAYQFNDSGVRWVFVSSDLAERLPDRPAVDVEVCVIGLDGAPGAGHDYTTLFDEEAGLPEFGPVEAEDLVLLQYTSGTTGPPKAAGHTHGTVMWNSLHQIPDCGMTPDDVYLCLPALCWAAGLHDFTLATLWLGGTVVLHPSRGLKVEAVLDNLERHRVTLSLIVPSVLQLMVSSGELATRDLSSLRAIYSGSAPVPVALLEEAARLLPATRLLQAFGMSEFPTLMTVLDDEHAMAKVGSAGRPTIVTALKVVDVDGRECPPGTNGEIVVRSPATMVGYFGRDDANAQAFAGGWFHTGDLGHLDEDGFVYIAGRAKDMIISGGLNVYPAEIEAALQVHPSVVEVAVLGVQDAERGEAGLAVVVVDDTQDVTVDALRMHVRGHLASYKIPKHWVVREAALPRTASGKVAKPVLRADLPDLLALAGSAAPATTAI
ncbi:MAG: Long-chain-fatty-acid--CoA ligase FadD13 [Marmoricola sp.]|jgi:fatty-acyl-CoA synthase|nr:Long-chain-fatty-acid--CoA ligase FadD13 [Marmoricola sp.]